MSKTFIADFILHLKEKSRRLASQRATRRATRLDPFGPKLVCMAWWSVRSVNLLAAESLGVPAGDLQAASGLDVPAVAAVLGSPCSAPGVPGGAVLRSPAAGTSDGGRRLTHLAQAGPAAGGLQTASPCADPTRWWCLAEQTTAWWLVGHRRPAPRDPRVSAGTNRNHGVGRRTEGLQRSSSSSPSTSQGRMTSLTTRCSAWSSSAWGCPGAWSPGSGRSSGTGGHLWRSTAREAESAPSELASRKAAF